ncbi:MAG: excinuclease ABC subunit UvrC [Gammaproteobacteria bacterium]
MSAAAKNSRVGTESAAGNGSATGYFDPRDFVARAARGSGIYRFYDTSERLIYVGKARDLRRRLSSYFGRRPASAKVAAMLRQLARIELTRTANEVEALLLESTLIKRHRPRYNVLLRDDKSYPYIRMEEGLGFPRLAFYRGPRRAGTRLFGPYPNAGAARATLTELQRVFRLRNCTDRYFLNRTRPCLQYQIERCSAPCVGYIGEGDYARDLTHAVDFLEGRDESVIGDMGERMESASAALEYEQAARIRDQIQRLRQVRAHQDVVSGLGDCDILAIAVAERSAVVVVLPVRHGRVLESRHYLLAVGVDEEPSVALASFIAQHYLEHVSPPRLIPDRGLQDAEILAAALSARAEHPITIRPSVRGTSRRLIGLAANNAREALAVRTGAVAAFETRYAVLERSLDLPAGSLGRIECFDISHSGGEATVGSCVVFERSGPLKSAYRRYRVRGAAAGDDYAALAEVLARRYGRLKAEGDRLPDLVLVDGGPAQVRRAATVLKDLKLETLRLAGITKGQGRRARLDRLVLAPDGHTLSLPSDSPALHLVQALRDESHRFALTGHRRARTLHRRESVLDAVPGVGPLRRRQLLTRFGGLRGLQRASTMDLETVPGISHALATRIVQHLSET